MELSKGQIEAKICEEITAFEKNFMGRGPNEIKAYIIDDMILVRLKGVLTPAEISLSGTWDGAKLIKQVRSKLIENSSEYLGNLIHNITKTNVQYLHTDINPATGERIFVFTLDVNFARSFSSTESE